MSFSGGGISSRPIIHGMADDRLRTQVDGMNLISSCANHMNPALSYVAPSSVLSARCWQESRRLAWVVTVSAHYSC